MDLKKVLIDESDARINVPNAYFKGVYGVISRGRQYFVPYKWLNIFQTNLGFYLDTKKADSERVNVSLVQ